MGILGKEEQVYFGLANLYLTMAMIGLDSPSAINIQWITVDIEHVGVGLSNGFFDQVRVPDINFLL